MSASLRAVAGPAAPAPWWGRPWEHRQAAVAGVGSLAAGLAYLAATHRWAPDAAPGPVELWGTITSLWAVWITQRQNVLAQPVGIVSVLLMGWFFLQIGLVGQAALHWGFYLPVQAWAWQQWTRGGAEGGELAVTWLPARGRVVAVLAVVGGTLLGGWALQAGPLEAVLTWWDASIVAASVVAQLLLSRKKAESWWLWIGPVDVSAIGLYALSGAWMFAALYVLFLVMAVVGLVRWVRAAGAGAAGQTPRSAWARTTRSTATR